MIINAFVAYIHFIAAFTLVFSILYEWITFNKSIALLEAKRIQRIDIMYGVSAGVILIFGFLRVLYFEKGSEFYFGTPFFQIKLYTFLLLGLISIYPTIKFLKWREDTNLGIAPVVTEKEFTIVKWILRIEVIGLLVIILAASLMAKGVGY